MFAGILGGIGIKMLMVGVLVAAAAGLYFHYQSVVNERNAALQQVGALTLAKRVQDDTIAALEANNDEWKQALSDFQATMNEVATNQIKNTEHVRKLENVLSRHDLHALSLAKPVLVERVINNGTRDVFRMFESATSGSKDGSSTSGPPARETNTP